MGGGGLTQYVGAHRAVAHVSRRRLGHQSSLLLATV